MLASILIIAFSLVLLVYWFRYSCILLLRNYPSAVAAPAVADTRFSVSEVQERLRTEESLDPLHAALDRDYQVLSYLLAHAAGLELGSFEDQLLVLDYKLMRSWYRLTKTAAPVQARNALSEMASVLSVLVGKIDQRAGVNIEA